MDCPFPFSRLLPFRKTADRRAFTAIKREILEKSGLVCYSNHEILYAFFRNPFPKRHEEIFMNHVDESAKMSIIFFDWTGLGLSLPIQRKAFIKQHTKRIVMTEGSCSVERCFFL